MLLHEAQPRLKCDISTRVELKVMAGYEPLKFGKFSAVSCTSQPEDTRGRSWTDCDSCPLSTGRVQLLELPVSLLLILLGQLERCNY